MHLLLVQVMSRHDRSAPIDMGNERFPTGAGDPERYRSRRQISAARSFEGGADG